MKCDFCSSKSKMTLIEVQKSDPYKTHPLAAQKIRQADHPILGTVAIIALALKKVKDAFEDIYVFQCPTCGHRREITQVERVGNFLSKIKPV